MHHLISPHLRTHYISLPWPFTPDMMSFTTPLLSSTVSLDPSGLSSQILTSTELRGHWHAFVLTLLFFLFLATRARLS